MAQTGNLYVIAAPSGTGKTSLVKALTERLPHVAVSISHTTRSIRPGEEHGVNYFFVEKAQFKQMIERHEFLEYATVFENFYGTSKLWVEKTLQEGIDVILEIDWQGHQQIKRLFPGSIGIFVLPPTLTDLKERLTGRNQDSAEVIAKRLADVKETVSHVQEFEYLVVNDDFDRAIADLTTILSAGRLLTKAQLRKYERLIADLSNFATN